uniref:Uncharacterized protein n=1 Tax=Polytomella parva TaxID=51329 RepID=A0A7S0YHW8_9CHLO|mmetsp:Transcript_30484/g.55626  ORF Transcript_30484/g.55626 Transcript_30484/m.55626 type:complete len:293 (+) Transcript_30484:278-1156(+)|eukprot:CAMPEP_0175079594 /NCGR_PEP_ID=MMETSP0052_2-20121109/24912_1 /TAXON_ID=51329 ORGANISM="Polytomella parva, Strain SAG 63-3" /NCGR_SAMPLE_ID=MMETSP0052_2 /ASSEMBLY_ACC=CAM_ASM_000194 /LENGTH=292 /DNA_ID=CAMNT_0016349947 /DNA_START=186 /DNA_END=1064 /DNA_ORIENTATION=+
MKLLSILLLVSTLALSLKTTEAAPKFTVTKAVAYNATVVHNSPHDNCTTAGICHPMNLTIPSKTLWYWCGFLVTHRLNYTVTQKVNGTAKFSAEFVRERFLTKCLNNLTAIASCFSTAGSIDYTTCDSSTTTCSANIPGMSFPDDVCLVIGNSASVSLNATLRVTNQYDSMRYYGTVFVIFFTAIGCLGILGQMSYQLYEAYQAPIGRSRKPPRRRRNIPLNENGEADVADINATIVFSEKGKEGVEVALASNEVGCTGGTLRGQLDRAKTGVKNITAELAKIGRPQKYQHQ